MSDDRDDFMQSPRHRVRERGSRRLALRSFFVKLCRARAIQLCALFTLAVNANAFRRERGWSIETSACDVRTSQRLGWPGSQTSKAEEVSVTLGTVIRGTEWSGRTANDRAVLNALDGLKRLVGRFHHTGKKLTCTLSVFFKQKTRRAIKFRQGKSGDLWRILWDQEAAVPAIPTNELSKQIFATRCRAPIWSTR